jgi:two-component system response regulator MprA
MPPWWHVLPAAVVPSMSRAMHNHSKGGSPVAARAGSVSRMTVRTGSEHALPVLVLVVDDEPGIVEFLRFALEDNGYRVATANDGGQALETVEREEPDVVITDLMMPRVDGWELCRQLRARRSTRRVPIIGMSAVDASGAALDSFLRKPFELDDLLSELDRLAGRRSA